MSHRVAPRPCPPAQALAERRRWDCVVFDPPKLAPSRKTLERATRKYRRLNALAMQVVVVVVGGGRMQAHAGPAGRWLGPALRCASWHMNLRHGLAPQCG